MQKLIPLFIDITTWNKIPYSSTGGTRAKNIYVFPENGKEYFFKGSKKLTDGTFKYPTEFWSEIVASKVGQLLGFNLLDYDIGYDLNDEQKIGCLSKSMVEHSENKLSEGVDFLRGFDSSYNPKVDETRYTVNFIEDTLTYFDLSQFLPEFLKMLIFDSIIGNSDRHQENWGFISKFRETFYRIDEEINNTRGFFSRVELKLRKLIAKMTLEQSEIQQLNSEMPSKTLLKTQSQIVETIFSPIYDSGCCLGRELDEVRVKRMLEDSQMLNAYVNRGQSEVRWSIGRKPRHFEFMRVICQEYPDLFKSVLEDVRLHFDKKNLKRLIDNIDVNLPLELQGFNLPPYRKLLMFELIILRIEKLYKLI